MGDNGVSFKTTILADTPVTTATPLPVTSVSTVGDTDVEGKTAHDAAGTSTNPVAGGGYASAAAPSDVSGDNDIVRAWHLRNGAAAVVLTAAGALIGGDATNGMDVDVTRTPKATSATNAIVTADGTALASNASRKAWSIQNLDDAAVYVKMGASASASDFNVVLKAGTAANDGNGGFFSDNIYTGIVTILAAAGSPRVVVTEV